LVKSALTYAVKGAEHTPRFRQGKWDGTKSLMRYSRFPAGLLSLVLDSTLGPHEIEDNRPEQSVKLSTPNLRGIKLRDYQKEAIDAFLKNERGIIRLATRSGKTVIAIGICKALKKKSLFVTHTKDLLKQARAEFEDKLGKEIGQIGDGEWNPRKITIATVQTLARKIKQREKSTLNELAQVEYVVFDECHRASTSYQAVSLAMPKARWRLGLSATACITGKENSLYTQALTGPIIYEIDMEKLVDEGRIAKPVVYFIDIPNKNKVKEWTKWPSIYQDGIVQHHVRNLLVTNVAVRMSRMHKVVLVLVESVEHGHTLESLIGKYCVCQFVSGSDLTEDRKEALEDLQKRRIDVLVATRIFDEGVDIPLVDCTIMAAGGKSPIQLYQRYGRGITKTPTKAETLIIDFIDRSHPRLKEHSYERMAIVNDDKAFQVHTTTLDQLFERLTNP